MTLDVYAHVFDEFDPADRASAEETIRQARADVSVLCPLSEEQVDKTQETPANPYSPICLPRISFMSPERGTGGHAGSCADTNPLQLRLFGEEGN